MQKSNFLAQKKNSYKTPIPYLVEYEPRHLLKFSCLKCGAYLRTAFIRKLDATKNLFNDNIVINLTELTSFDFECIWASAFISGRRSLTFLSQMRLLFEGGVYSSKYGILCLTVVRRSSLKSDHMLL